MSVWTQKTVKETADKVVARAVTDAEFRALALSDAKKAIGEINPEPIPDAYRIRFVDNAGATFTLVLPDMPAPGGELSDADLEQVAGGRISASDVGEAIGTVTGFIVRVVTAVI